MDYTIDKDAPKLDMWGDRTTEISGQKRDGTTVDLLVTESAPVIVCKDDQSEMIYDIATDQWQCPQCGAVSNGGKPQASEDDIPDHLRDGSSNP